MARPIVRLNTSDAPMTTLIGLRALDEYATLEAEQLFVLLDVVEQCSLTEHLKFKNQHSHQR